MTPPSQNSEVPETAPGASAARAESSGAGAAGGAAADAPAPSSAAGRTPRRSRGRRLARLALWSVAGLAVGWGLLTHSPLTAALVVPRLQGLFGASVAADGARINLDGSVTLLGARLRAPGLDGPAADVAQVRRLRAWVDWGALLSGRGEGAVSRIELVEPTVRVSQSLEDRTLNVAALKAPTGDPEGPIVVPRVRVLRGSIELGEHARGSYTMLKRLPLEGVVERSPDPGDAGAYLVDMREVREVDAPMAPGLTLVGRITPQRVRLAMEGLRLSDWPAAVIPSASRAAYADMDLQGAVRRLVVEHDFAGTTTAVMTLDDVSVNLPVDRTDVERTDMERPEAPGEGANASAGEGAVASAPGTAAPGARQSGGERLRMSGTSGEVRFLSGRFEAELEGMLQDVPYSVRVDVEGVSPDAPFRVRLTSSNYSLVEKPQILRFAPPKVRQRLAQLSNPTGRVTAWILVERAAPTPAGPAPVKVRGTLQFDDGSAAFERFPYRFEGLAGIVEFTDERLDIVEVVGSAPSGAKIEARGWIAPLNEAAGAHLDIRVRHAPIDETLARAMGPRRALIDTLFDRGRYEALVSDGLIAPPHAPPDAPSGVPSGVPAAGAPSAPPPTSPSLLPAGWVAPAFTLGGVVDVDVGLDMPQGVGTKWRQRIEVRFPRVGVLTEKFPLPLVGENVTAVVQDDDVSLTRAVLTTVSGGGPGGRVTLDASADLSRLDDEKNPGDVRITARAERVPADALLVWAGVHAGRGLPAETQRSLRRMARDLGVAGLAGGELIVGATDSGELGFEARAEAPALTFDARTPTGERSRATLGEARASLRVTQDVLEATLAGAVADATRPADPPAPTEVTVRAALSERGPVADNGDRLVVTVRASDLDARTPVEDLARVFTEPGARAAADVRAKLEPRGVTHAMLVVGSALARGEENAAAPGANVNANAAGVQLRAVTIDGPARVEFNGVGGRLALQDRAGALVFTPGDGPEGWTAPRIAFQEFTARADFNGAPAGRVAGAGQGPLALLTAPNSPPPAPRAGDRVELRAEGGAFESDLTRALVAGALGERAGRTLADMDPRGVFDATVEITPPGNADAPAVVRGSVRPRQVEATLGGQRITAQRAEGELQFEPGGGALRGLRVEGEGWSAGADGSFLRVPGATSYDLALDLRSPALNDAVRGVLPRDLLNILNELSVRVDGPLTVPRAQVTFTRTDEGQTPTFRARGEVAFEGGALSAGVEVREATGTLRFEADRAGPGEPARFLLGASAERLRAAGLTLTGVEARASSTPTPGQVRVSSVSGDCHGGRVTGEALLSPDGAGGRTYETRVAASGVRFRDALTELRAVGPEEIAPPPGAPGPALDAGLELRGRVGDVASRRGRGSATIGGGRVVNLPLLMPLVRVANLRLPIDEPLSLATASFFIDGPEVLFEELTAQSESVLLMGRGSVTWPDMALDLRFTSRASRRLPVVSRVVESLRDELVTINAGGTLNAPELSASTLSGTRRALGRILGRQPTEAEQRLDAMGRRMDQEVDRTRGLRSGPQR